MAASSGPLTCAIDVVRRTNAAHASALDALERAFHADMVPNQRLACAEDPVLPTRSIRRRYCARAASKRSKMTARP
jgi:hypothetical protein